MKEREIIEIALRLKTCFDYRETAKMDNKMDIERRVDEDKKKTKAITRFHSSETLKEKLLRKFSAWLCNYIMMFTTVLKSLKVKATTATSFPISSLTPDGKIKFYVVEKIENYSRNFLCQFSSFLMSLNIITQSPLLFRRTNEKEAKIHQTKEGKRLHKIWIKLQ